MCCLSKELEKLTDKQSGEHWTNLVYQDTDNSPGNTDIPSSWYTSVPRTETLDSFLNGTNGGEGRTSGLFTRNPKRDFNHTHTQQARISVYVLICSRDTLPLFWNLVVSLRKEKRVSDTTLDSMMGNQDWSQTWSRDPDLQLEFLF
jgi:hypothetical protein